MQPEQQDGSSGAVRTVDGADMPLQQAHRLTKDKKQLVGATTLSPHAVGGDSY